MAHWDCRAQRVIAWPTQPWPGRPGWLQVDCGCSAGLMWGGESPRECPRCQDGGVLALHEKSRRLALWPGGPFCGSEPKSEAS